MRLLKKIFILTLKQLDLGTALAVRLTKLTGKSKVSVHPKHLLEEKPWFLNYIKKGDLVLDLGCGNSQNTVKAAKIAANVVGLEIDPHLLQIAKKSNQEEKLKNVQFLSADLEKKLNLPSATFDKVIFLDVLEHLKNRNQALSEVRRVLKPNGILLLGVPNSQTTWKKFQRSAKVCSFSDADHKIEYSENSIKQLLKKHKFKIVKFSYGKYDTPLKGIFDAIGGFSLSIYKTISLYRAKKTRFNPKEASGFEIVVTKEP